MIERIVIIQGHPNPDGKRFGHALADAYASGAEEAGYSVSRINVADLKIPMLESEEQWQAEAPEAVVNSQDLIRAAKHIVIVYPLWMGAMPAVLKAYFEQIMRPGFALDYGDEKSIPKKLLKGRSARIIVTMGMPAAVYRWYFGAHSLRNLKRNILKFCGMKPVSYSLIGLAGTSQKKREKWLRKMSDLGSLGL